MIKIYFDNELINDDDYLEIKNNYTMFDSNFYLGATPCNSFTIKVPNVYEIPNEVKIKMDDVDYATLIVDSYSIDDNDILKLNLVDKMVLFDKKYDASGIVPCTTMDILSDICSITGVQLGTNAFINDDIPVNYYDNTYTARDYISFIAELNGGYAQIGEDGKLYLKQFNNTPIELDIDTCENFKIGEKRKIRRVVFDNGLLKFVDYTRKNLFNKDAVEAKHYITNEGTLGNSNNYSASDYIVVSGMQKVTTSGNTNIQPEYASKVAFYKIDKTFISYNDIALGSNTYTVPSNAYYMRITSRNSDLNNIQLEEGDHATEYEPYDLTNYNKVDTLYLNNSNVYINTQETFDNIANQILNFEFYNFSTGNCEVDYNATCGKLIKFVDGNNEYVSISQYNHDYNGSWLGGYELKLDSVLQNETKIIDDSEKIKAIKITQDRQANEIGILIEDIDDQNEEIADIRLKYNEILSRISDIADITTSGESSYASVTLLNVNTSQPIDVKIKPMLENISYLYPSNNLYPSDSLYSKARTLRFLNTTTNETFDWELPTNLWYYNASIFDELELSYGDGTNGTVTVTRRCEIDSSGAISVKATPTTETYPYPASLVLTDGDYTVSLLGYTSAYLYVQLMAKNIYTTQFYTQAETNSLVNQKAGEINLSVDQKLSNYSTTAQMNSAITLKANEITSTVSETYATKTTTNTLSSRIGQTAKEISLTVNNGDTSSGITITNTKEDGTTETTSGTIQMNGLVKFTDLSNTGSTTINGSNITTGTISADRLSSNVITTDNFSAQNINASNITSGTLNVDRISANSITSGKINNLSASKISGGTISGIAFNNGSGTFSVTTGGYLTAVSGKFGSWTLNGTGIYSNNARIYPDYLGYKIGGTGAWASESWWRIAQTSDKKAKQNIEELKEAYNQFFDDLKPVSFEWKNSEDKKKHIGFIAQDIQDAQEKNNLDLDMVYQSEGSNYLSLDKKDIIALNTWQIQMLKQEIKELKQEIESLKGGK